jgi:hypothetical protein
MPVNWPHPLDFAWNPALLRGGANFVQARLIANHFCVYGFAAVTKAGRDTYRSQRAVRGFDFRIFFERRPEETES